MATGASGICSNARRGEGMNNLARRQFMKVSAGTINAIQVAGSVMR